jgi:hypothetical protein
LSVGKIKMYSLTLTNITNKHSNHIINIGTNTHKCMNACTHTHTTPILKYPWTIGTLHSCIKIQRN